jgi:hypothetical protein
VGNGNPVSSASPLYSSRAWQRALLGGICFCSLLLLRQASERFGAASAAVSSKIEAVGASLAGVIESLESRLAGRMDAAAERAAREHELRRLETLLPAIEEVSVSLGLSIEGPVSPESARVRELADSMRTAAAALRRTLGLQA